MEVFMRLFDMFSTIVVSVFLAYSLFIFVACVYTPEKSNTTEFSKSSPAYGSYEEANKLKNKIDKFKFNAYAPSEYTTGEDNYNKAKDKKKLSNLPKPRTGTMQIHCIKNPSRISKTFI
jgi:hypothetical protein